MKLFDDLGNLFGKVGNVFSDLINAVKNIINAMQTFLNMLDDLDSRIVQMTNLAKSGTISDIPLFKTIGTFRFLMGDLAFYCLYMIVLFGCLITISKIAMVLYGSVTRIKDNMFPDGLSLTSIKNLFTH